MILESRSLALVVPPSKSQSGLAMVEFRRCRGPVLCLLMLRRLRVQDMFRIQG